MSPEIVDLLKAHRERSSLSPYGALRCAPIPDELKYPGMETDEVSNGWCLLHLWMYFRRNEPIPEELKFPGW